jgi:hypothetical protein
MKLLETEFIGKKLSEIKYNCKKDFTLMENMHNNIFNLMMHKFIFLYSTAS